MSPAVEAVIFDMDGVLCAYDFPARLDHMARLTGRPTAEIRAVIFESGWDDLSDRGEIDSETYLAGCADRLGVPLPRDAWLEARGAAMTPDPEVLAMARALAARLPVAVFTNNNRLVADNLATLFPQLAEIFGAHIYVSAMLGLSKPDPAAFAAVLGHLGGTAPDRVLFVDDRDDYVAGAVRAGLRTHRFTDAATLRTVLSELSLI